VYVDPRGPRFGAALTTLVLALVLVTGSGWLLAAQAVVFAIGAFAGLERAPYGLVYRALLAPRLPRPGELEAEASPRFGQAVGLLFAVVGAAGYLSGVPALGIVATAAALAAAFGNAAFGFCLGCQTYLLARRARGRPALTRFVPPNKGVPT